MHATLAALRRDPHRGRAVVLDIQGQVSGYALLIAFWSNELGGDICEVDELFVAPEHRNQGHGTTLFSVIVQGNLWPAPIAAIVLGTTPDNATARRLYERLGFVSVGISMVRCLLRGSDVTTAAEDASFRNPLPDSGTFVCSPPQAVPLKPWMSPGFVSSVLALAIHPPL
jgi:N-acetylglutamate synthase-like GNAT family acetyltransferase